MEGGGQHLDRRDKEKKNQDAAGKGFTQEVA